MGIALYCNAQGNELESGCGQKLFVSRTMDRPRLPVGRWYGMVGRLPSTKWVRLIN